jgi:hypothetical protein
LSICRAKLGKAKVLANPTRATTNYTLFPCCQSLSVAYSFTSI